MNIVNAKNRWIFCSWAFLKRKEKKALQVNHYNTHQFQNSKGARCNQNFVQSSSTMKLTEVGMKFQNYIRTFASKTLAFIVASSHNASHLALQQLKKQLVEVCIHSQQIPNSHLCICDFMMICIKNQHFQRFLSMHV